jgi:hypothetical protein
VKNLLILLSLIQSLAAFADPKDIVEISEPPRKKCVTCAIQCNGIEENRYIQYPEAAGCPAVGAKFWWNLSYESPIPLLCKISLSEEVLRAPCLCKNWPFPCEVLVNPGNDGSLVNQSLESPSSMSTGASRTAD